MVLSETARKNIYFQTNCAIEHVGKPASVIHVPANTAASISSGSFRTDGVAAAPCTMKTLPGIGNSCNDDLIARAADVMLKEKRKLVLIVRKTPLYKGHLELMNKVTDIGGITLLPISAF